MKYILLFALFFSACKTEKKDLLLAKNFTQNNYYGLRTIFCLDGNNNFSLSFVPVETNLNQNSIIYKGEYFIEKNHIYFKNQKVLKEAIINDGYVEILDLMLKINIVENNTNIKTRKRVLPFTDYSLFSFSSDLKFPFETGKSATLSDIDIYKIDQIVKLKMEIENPNFSKDFIESNYNKQCICIINKKGEKHVWVNCIKKESTQKDKSWENQILEVSDGGEAFFNLKINLTTGIVYEFQVNGNA